MKELACLIVIAWYTAVFSFQPSDSTQRYFRHSVKKGETVSLICIDLYGRYTNEMGKVILKENPSVKNINVIFVGQDLQMHNPAFKAASAAKKEELFEKKISFTQGVVTYVEGDVWMFPKGASAKQQCNPNTIVNPGDVIRTGANGRAELIINRETVVRIKENTKLVVEAFRDNEKNTGKTQIGFSVGSVWAKMKKFKDKISRFDLELPTAIAGVHGTVYEATIGNDSSSEVKVFAGEVAVKNNPAITGQSEGEVAGPGEVSGPSEVSMEQWVSIVRDMQKISIDKKGNPRPVEQFKRNEVDSWEQWNYQRDKRIAQMFEETEE